LKASHKEYILLQKTKSHPRSVGVGELINYGLGIFHTEFKIIYMTFFVAKCQVMMTNVSWHKGRNA